MAMETLRLTTRVGSDGLVKLEIPTDLTNQDVEIVVVMQPLEREALDAMGYPVGYFEETYGMFAADPLERNQPPQPDARDALE